MLSAAVVIGALRIKTSRDVPLQLLQHQFSLDFSQSLLLDSCSACLVTDRTSLGVAGCAGNAHCPLGIAVVGTGYVTLMTGMSQTICRRSLIGPFPSLSESKNLQLDFSVNFLLSFFFIRKFHYLTAPHVKYF